MTQTIKIDAEGTKRYYNNQNQLHREDGPAIEYNDGAKEWWVNGKRHRENGPAIEYPDGYKEWYINDKLHREYGPAVERADGRKYWCIRGEYLSEAIFRIRTNIACKCPDYLK